VLRAPKADAEKRSLKRQVKQLEAKVQARREVRALEKKLKSAGIDVSSREAWQLLKTVRVVEIGVGAEKTTRSVTQGSGRASKILASVGLKHLDPDTRKTGKRAA